MSSLPASNLSLFSFASSAQDVPDSEWHKCIVNLYNFIIHATIICSLYSYIFLYESSVCRCVGTISVSHLDNPKYVLVGYPCGSKRPRHWTLSLSSRRVKYNPGKTNTINLLLLNNFYRRVRKRKRRIIVHFGYVATRYGPQSVTRRRWLTFSARGLEGIDKIRSRQANRSDNPAAWNFSNDPTTTLFFEYSFFVASSEEPRRGEGGRIDHESRDVERREIRRWKAAWFILACYRALLNGSGARC